MRHPEHISHIDGACTFREYGVGSRLLSIQHVGDATEDDSQRHIRGEEWGQLWPSWLRLWLWWFGAAEELHGHITLHSHSFVALPREAARRSGPRRRCCRGRRRHKEVHAEERAESEQRADGRQAR